MNISQFILKQISDIRNNGFIGFWNKIKVLLICIKNIPGYLTAFLVVLITRILSSIILIPLTIYFIIKGSFFFSFFLSILFLVTSYEWYQMSKKKTYFIPGILFLLLSFVSASIIRNIYGADFF